jgi:CDP-diacylglycerol--glycerol-3-phosphate 3-phosphatidyltransferase
MSEGYDHAAWRRLRWQWGITALVGVGVAVLGYIALSDWWTRLHGLQWAATAGVVLTYELWLLRRHLDLNRCGTAELLRSSLGVATAVTLIRGLVIAAVAGFLAVPEPTGRAAWLPWGLYAVAVALDWVDGWLARWRGKITLLGAKLDMEFDGVCLLVAALLGNVYGVLPPWYLAVGFMRPAFVAGTWLHRQRGGIVGSLPESAVRRELAAIQMIVCSIALLPVAGPPVSTAISTVAMIPFVGMFVRDFLAVRE